MSSNSSGPGALLRLVFYAAAIVMALLHVFVTFRGLSSAEGMNQAQLARQMLGSELLVQVMGTRQRGAVLSGPGGYQRNVLWKNTNELLGMAGYSGVKTGTTDKAGACLVSVGEREGRRVIVVVLGAAASESRYVDSRNLYRWIWSKSQPDQ